MVDVDSVVQPMLGHILQFQLVYFALQMLMCIVAYLPRCWDTCDLALLRRKMVDGVRCRAACKLWRPYYRRVVLFFWEGAWGRL